MTGAQWREIIAQAQGVQLNQICAFKDVIDGSGTRIPDTCFCEKDDIGHPLGAPECTYVPGAKIGEELAKIKALYDNVEPPCHCQFVGWGHAPDCPWKKWKDRS